MKCLAMYYFNSTFPKNGYTLFINFIAVHSIKFCLLIGYILRGITFFKSQLQLKSKKCSIFTALRWRLTCLGPSLKSSFHDGPKTSFYFWNLVKNQGICLHGYQIRSSIFYVFWGIPHFSGHFFNLLRDQLPNVPFLGPSFSSRNRHFRVGSFGRLS